MYMCIQFDKTRGNHSIGHPVFWPSYSMAKNYAVRSARIFQWWSEFTPDIPPRTYVMYVKIFKVPYGTPVVINEMYAYYEMYQNHIETVYDTSTTAAMIIQKYWRVIYNERFVAAVIIKKHLRLAIANPYTELCRRRLLREFSEMGNVN